MNPIYRKYRKTRFASSAPAPGSMPARTSPVLTREELRRIVAEMLG